MLCVAMQALKAAGVDFIVAPYEADAQMAYLALSGEVHAVCSLCCSESLLQRSAGNHVHI